MTSPSAASGEPPPFPGYNPALPVPPLLVAALKQECQVQSCHRFLAETVEEQRKVVSRLDHQHTPVDFLLAAAGRPRAISHDLSQAQEYLRQLEASLAGMDKIVAGIGRRVESLFEDYARRCMGEYVRGLAAMEHIKDWERGLERFDQRLAAYLTMLGQTRNNAVAGYDHARKKLSPTAEELLDAARDAAARLEEEIAFVNHLADLHQQAIAGTPCAAANLPTVPVAPYASWTADLRSMDIGPMQAEFTRILTILEMLKTEGIAILKQTVGTQSTQHRTLAQSFVLDRLSRTRAHAERHWFDASTLQATISALEPQFCKGREILFDFTT